MVHIAAPLVAAGVADSVRESVIECIVQVPMGIDRVETTFVAKGILGISMRAVTTLPAPAESGISSFNELPEILMELFMGLAEDPVLVVVAKSCGESITWDSHAILYRNNRGATFRHSAVFAISCARRQRQQLPEN